MVVTEGGEPRQAMLREPLAAEAAHRAEERSGRNRTTVSRPPEAPEAPWLWSV